MQNDNVKLKTLADYYTPADIFIFELSF